MKSYTKPSAQRVSLEATDILLTSGTGAQLRLQEDAVEVSGLSRFLWNEMSEN